MYKHATNRPKVHLKRSINRGLKTGRKRKNDRDKSFDGEQSAL